MYLQFLPHVRKKSCNLNLSAILSDVLRESAITFHHKLLSGIVKVLVFIYCVLTMCPT